MTARGHAERAGSLLRRVRNGDVSSGAEMDFFTAEALANALTAIALVLTDPAVDAADLLGRVGLTS